MTDRQWISLETTKGFIINYEIIGKTEYSSIICKTGEPGGGCGDGSRVCPH